MTDKQKRIKTALRLTVLVIAAAVIGLNVYGINSSRLAGDDMPMPFGVGAAVVLSGSMRPTFSEGDLLFVVECDSYNVGDIIVFNADGILITHRIISADGDTVITKGDANGIADEPINIAAVKGKVVRYIPFAGYIVNIIKTPIATLVILILAVSLVERSFSTQKQRDQAQIDSIRAEIQKLKDRSDKP